MLEKEKMFFIIGRGRSGTTLLSRMLGMNPNLHIAPEGLFIMDLYKKFGGLIPTEWSDQKLGQFVGDVCSFRRMETWGIERKQLIQELCRLNEGERSYGQICQKVYEHHASLGGKYGCLLLGDKNPLYSRYLPLIRKIFPEAKLIHLTRNIKDNILSYQNVYFDMNDIGSLAWRWKKYNQEIQLQKERFPDQFLTIDYEDLAANGEQELAKVARFLDIPFDPVMLDFSDHQDDRLAKLSWHKNLNQKLNTRSINKWKKEMSEGEIALVDFIDHANKRQAGTVRLSIRVKAFYSHMKSETYSLAEKSFFRLPLRLRSKLSNQLRSPDKR